ncbi:hypothetical protein Y032_0002g934 [Ancylostoma ceylanicum]|uniref:Receptor L-domain domain-containing protein n=1 Tax=Ancylostoma ceylanicum TaxID=53326 RepID=A0A016W1G9_9BILA|nr:hypothetical protein Y032_0002g934 [Ancylostoma ceylanicum]
MWLLLLLCFSSICYRASTRYALCDIKNVKELEKVNNCTHLRLYTDDVEVMRHPKLYEKIRTVTTIFKLKLFNTSLERITDAQNVELAKDSSLDIFDNPMLQRLPNLTIVDGKRVKLFILNNKKLDTSQLLEECKRKKCPTDIYRTIQMPFTCAFHRPVEPGCRFIFDNVDLRDYDKSLDQVEVVYGTLILRGSDVATFPKMPKLRQIEQKPGTPVLIIENNKKLSDLTSLFGVNIKVSDMKNAVKFSGNPKLCVAKKQRNEPFVIKFMTKIGFCKGSTRSDIHILKLIIVYLCIIFTEIY